MLFRSQYENLVCPPEQTLATLGEFLDHDLDYGRIQSTAIGRVASPNTVWKEESGAGTFSPIGRWKTKLSQPEISALEAMIGGCLEEFAYQVTTERYSRARLDPALRLMRIVYPRYFETKLFLQSRTVVGRLARGTRLELTSRAEDELSITSKRVDWDGQRSGNDSSIEVHKVPGFLEK